MEPQILRYLLDKACLLRQPVSGTLELTGRCNFCCRMCYIHQTRHDKTVGQRELTTEQWLELIRQAQEAGTLTMLLTGGEPLLRKDFEAIYLACRRAGFLVSVNTNAALMQERHFDLFEKYKPFMLNISLYGADNDTYEVLCGQKGVYQRVKANILELHSRGIPVRINYTATKENFHQHKEIYAFAKENGLLIQQTSYIFPPVRVCGSCEDAYQRVDGAMAGEMSFDCDFARYDEEALRGKLLNRPQLELPEEERTHMHCRAGVSAYWITYDGRLQICGMLQQPEADLMTEPLQQAWERLKAERQNVQMPEACACCEDKSWCEVCAAICVSENCGKKPPEYLCQKTRAYRNRAEKWLLEHTRNNE